MKSLFPPLFLAALGTLLTGCATKNPPATVASVDLGRYAGRWHEIARYPNWFQRDCDSAATAEYSPAPDGKIRVENSCLSKSGKKKVIVGSATPVPDSGNAKLKVRFFGPFAGDYWILALDPDYRWALVGHPSRKYLWILARDPSIPDALYSRIVTLAERAGYDPARIHKSGSNP